MPACSGIRLAEPQFSRWHPQSCCGTPWLAGSSALDSLQQSPNSGSAPPALSSSSWGPHTQCLPPKNHKPSMHTFPSMTYITFVCTQACLAELLLRMIPVSLESSGQQVTPYRLMPNTSDCRKRGGPCSWLLRKCYQWQQQQLSWKYKQQPSEGSMVMQVSEGGAESTTNPKCVPT